MAQVAFDTLQASEELQTAGLTSEQAKAISLVVRKSHEVADIATKSDLEMVRKDIKAVIQNHDAQLPICFAKTESEITNVRKQLAVQITEVCRDIEVRFEKTKAQIADIRKDMDVRFEKTDAQVVGVRRDMAAGFDKLGMQMTIRLGLMVAAAVSIIAAILKM